MHSSTLKLITIGAAVLLAGCTLLASAISADDQQKPLAARAANSTALASSRTVATAAPAALGSKLNSTVKHDAALRKVNRRDLAGAESTPVLSQVRMNPLGDTVGLKTALDSRLDLASAAGEHHKKYVLVKKKPKHKKIKMDVYEPKMKYKKIKMKVPIKKLKKKKVKGYLVKKEHGHY